MGGDTRRCDLSGEKRKEGKKTTTNKKGRILCYGQRRENRPVFFRLDQRRKDPSGQQGLAPVYMWGSKKKNA